jgi:hypothetical protein
VDVVALRDQLVRECRESADSLLTFKEERIRGRGDSRRSGAEKLGAHDRHPTAPHQDRRPKFNLSFALYNREHAAES